MEGAWFLAGHNLTSLSEEQLIHCSGQVRSRTQLSGLEFVCFQVVLIMPPVPSLQSVFDQLTLRWSCHRIAVAATQATPSAT